MIFVHKNFISQSRKGIIQLFEYNYFEINRFKSEKNLDFENENKVLVTSDRPTDNDYVNFINSLDVKTLAIKDRKQIKYGNSLSFDE